MTIDELERTIAMKLPKLLYVSGKSSTGKTTFARKMCDTYGYKTIELDLIVREAVIYPLGLESIEGNVFVRVCKIGDKPDWVERFVAESHRRINELLSKNQRIVIEGMVPNLDVLAQVLGHNQQIPRVIYFHPRDNSPTYVRNLTNRFMQTSATHINGLSNGFWEHINPKAFEQFCKDRVLTETLKEALKNYAHYSTEESKRRLLALQTRFPGLKIIYI